MTFTQLQSEVRTRLDEASATFWTDQDIKDAINDGYQEISDASEWFERNANLSLTANAVYYDLVSSAILSDEFLALRSAYNNQITRWLTPTTVGYLDGVRLGWETTTGEPQWFFMRSTWQLGLYPKKATSVGTVRLYYSAIPAALSAAGDTPGFPQEFHPGLVQYALYDLLGQEAETAKALDHWRQYLGYQQALRNYMQDRIQRNRISGYK